jgi:cytochrome d ubiquinol oxidase subunit II
MGYLGLGLSIFPWIVPFHFTLWQAAAGPPSLSLLLVGITITLPLILFYTGYCFYVFRGKATHEQIY